jgi:hypothetical protein
MLTGGPLILFPVRSTVYLYTVSNFDERNATVHAVLLSVESHRPFDGADACPDGGNRKRQLLLLGDSAYREVAVKRNGVGTGLFNLC